ncbi:MAG: hypothetical protein ABI867_30085 [Kofleriaceae bacterium]
MRRFLAIALVLVSFSCGDTTTTPPSQLNLDRPTDIAFGCFGGLRITDGRTVGSIEDPVELSAQPTTACDIRSQDHAMTDPDPLPPGQEDLSTQGGFPLGGTAWFGFILQQGPGTVAIARFNTKSRLDFVGGDVLVLDADPLTPGKNSISIGEDPVAIATDAAGCKVVTANAGSCDLSVMDIRSAVDADTEGTPIDVQRLEVRNAAGLPLRSRPAAMVAEPSIDVIGKRCSATASGLMYIAYPSCHLVATVDVSTGTVVGGIQYDAAGVPSLVDGNVTCPDECSGGATITAGIRPVTLDLERDARTNTRRLVIGADNAPAIALVELDPVTTLPTAAPAQIALENTTGNLGITHITMTPQIGMGGQIHVINDDSAAGGQFQFVYAIATDDTIRVADILNLRKECDTQVDPRLLRDIRSIKDLSCLPVGDPATPPRRPGVKGPGIELTGEVVPLSIDIVKSAEVPDDARLEEVPGKLIGYFGIVGASNGAMFVINVDDDDHRDLFEPTRPLLSPIPLSIAHQVRDSIPLRGDLAVETVGTPPVNRVLCDVAGPDDGTTQILGGPRAVTAPVRNIPLGAYAAAKATQLPGLRQVLCDGSDGPRAVPETSFSAPESVRDEVFPDVRSLPVEETWTLTWEGSLSTDTFDTSVDGPQIRESQLFVDQAGMRMVDNSRPFCDAGVEEFDIVQMRGCDPSFGDTDCPIGYTCFLHPNSQVQGVGACMLADEADRLADACKDFLTSVRRYTVATSNSGVLTLMPRRLVLRTTPLDGCNDAAQCDALADVAAQSPSPANPIDETTVDDHAWSCEADPTRKPLQPAVNTGKRCLLKCDTTADCVTGTICQGGVDGSGAKAGYCMEGVVPPQACVNGPQRYEVRAGDAFAVVGQRTGFQHGTIADASGNCIKDPTASPLLTGRIPLAPEACDTTVDPITGRRPDGTFGPNPCSTTVAQTELQPVYQPNTCVLAAEPTVLATRQAPAIQYHNRGMNLTIVDPTYPGDSMCLLDRGGTSNIPLVVSGYQIALRQTAGFAPLFVPITPSLPVKVVRGPTNSIWVIDEGDFLSTSIAQPSTRGKVFRVEPHSLSTINILE